MSSPPFVLRATGWRGNDGNWSTFRIGVGTPVQTFDVLPSTSDGEIWVPVPDACDSSILGCAASRGVGTLNGVQNSGFQANESTTWELTGIYESATDKLVYPAAGDTALYGLDSVSIGGSEGPVLAHQIVGGTSSLNFWLGSLGLGAQPARFPNLPETAATLLDAAKAENISASISYGYSTGASYRNSPGSIVMGGYDQAAFEPSNISFPLSYAGSRSLTSRLRGLVVSNTPQGTIAPRIEAAGLNMTLDSSIAQIWLPESICDTLATALGLTYDEGTNLYFVSSTARSALLSAAPEFTFTLAAEAGSNVTTNIVLPYAAFDQQIGQPYSTSDTMYFPLRRAANESQFVLGRTFTQEAYLVVDWERQNFTLGQALHTPGVSNKLVTIQPVTSDKGSTSTLPVGAIAGIAVGAVVLFALIGVWFWMSRRKKRRQRQGDDGTHREPQAQTADYGYPADKKDLASAYGGEAELAAPETKLAAELMASQRHEMHSPYKEKSGMVEISRAELHGDDNVQQLMSAEVYELPGHESTMEMEAGGPSREADPVTAVPADRTPDGSPVQIGTLDRLGWDRAGPRS